MDGVAVGCQEFTLHSPTGIRDTMVFHGDRIVMTITVGSASHPEEIHQCLPWLQGLEFVSCHSMFPPLIRWIGKQCTRSQSFTASDNHSPFWRSSGNGSLSIRNCNLPQSLWSSQKCSAFRINAMDVSREKLSPGDREINFWRSR